MYRLAIKTYLQIALVIILFVGIIGLLAPYFISAKSTELFLIGIFICFAFPVIASWLIIKIYKNGRKLHEKI